MRIPYLSSMLDHVIHGGYVFGSVTRLRNDVVRIHNIASPGELQGVVERKGKAMVARLMGTHFHLVANGAEVTVSKDRTSTWYMRVPVFGLEAARTLAKRITNTPIQGGRRVSVFGSADLMVCGVCGKYGHSSARCEIPSLRVDTRFPMSVQFREMLKDVTHAMTVLNGSRDGDFEPPRRGARFCSRMSRRNKGRCARCGQCMWAG